MKQSGSKASSASTSTTNYNYPQAKKSSSPSETPRNREIKTEELDLSDRNSFDYTYTLPENTVGAYQFKVTVLGKDLDDDQTFSRYFHVQEFRRNAFEITSKIHPLDIAQRDLQLDINAQYYQGTPVAEGRVQWFSTVAQIGFYPDNFRDFQFGDHRSYDPYYWSHYFGYGSSSRYRDTEHNNGNAQLSENGTTTINTTIPEPDFPHPNTSALKPRSRIHATKH
ncbi:hypothetical protein [Rubritalea tangerina]|uniref:hypothetical protein n=1 Tax=Rubritalea tangerina TaxID=430798 RepID=UPI003610685B